MWERERWQRRALHVYIHHTSPCNRCHRKQSMLLIMHSVAAGQVQKHCISYNLIKSLKAKAWVETLLSGALWYKINIFAFTYTQFGYTTCTTCRFNLILAQPFRVHRPLYWHVMGVTQLIIGCHVHVYMYIN